MESEQYFEIGKIGKTKGFSGELFIKITNEEVWGELEEIKGFHIPIENHVIFYPIISIKTANSGKVSVVFNNIDSIEKAQQLKNKTVYILTEEVPALDEDDFFNHELIGCTVEDVNKGMIGTIEHVDTSSAQDLIFAYQDDVEFIIPLIDEFIIEFNKDKRILKLEVPDGLLDVNK